MELPTWYRAVTTTRAGLKPADEKAAFQIFEMRTVWVAWGGGGVVGGVRQGQYVYVGGWERGVGWYDGMGMREMNWSIWWVLAFKSLHRCPHRKGLWIHAVWH